MNVALLIEQIKKGNVEPFRNNFDALSFDEVSRVYEAVTPHFGVQRHFDYKQFKAAAEAVELSGVVAELGDHDGKLAEMTLHDFPDISEWIGFDVCGAAERCDHPKYKHVLLSDWFHNSATLAGIDAFVSTHTLEHMGRKAAFETLDFIAESEVKKMVLEMPFRPTGNWNKSKSLHVFNGPHTDIANRLKGAGWEIVYHGVTGMNHTWGVTR